MLNCQQVTQLIERQTDQPLTWGTELFMRVHLRLCVLCRRYQHQTRLINRLAALPSAGGATPRLSPEFKAQLGVQLQARLRDQEPPLPAPAADPGSGS